jgi:hypothetical protein
MAVHKGVVEAQNEILEGLYTSAVVADSHHLDEDPDPHESEKSDPGPHLSE